MIDHKRITAFADVTEDHQFIHLDSDRAVAETSFDGTIAHGYLTLSMASAFAYEVMQEIEGQTASVNYGFEKIPVFVIRLHPEISNYENIISNRI